jgi:hypothetical protein
MLNIPTLTALLSVIGVALLATTVLIVLLNVAFDRARTTAAMRTAKPAASSEVPAPRQQSSQTGDQGRRIPVTTR